MVTVMVVIMMVVMMAMVIVMFMVAVMVIADDPQCSATGPGDSRPRLESPSDKDSSSCSDSRGSECFL
jgi:hypothetical protein